MFLTAKQIHAGEKELQDRAEIFHCGPNLVLVVADGAGGMSGGAEAAEFVLNGIKKQIASVDLNSEALNKLLISLDQEMASIAAFGETTCVIAIVSDNGVVGSSVGDSGSFVFSKASVDNLTAGQIRKPFLGSGRANPAGFTRKQLDGTLLVASDGLLKYTSTEKVAATILAADLEVAANKLVDLVRYQSGALPDDISVLLARKS